MSYFVVTGASSGIGEAMCDVLASHGYDLIIAARRTNRLEIIKERIAKKYGQDVIVMSVDLTDLEAVKEMYHECTKYPIIGLINNAGCGVYGEFIETSLEDELKMIDLNIKTVHCLSKLFLKDFIQQDKGFILNVASIAAFQAGPLMAAYYASKGYVLQLTEAITKELKEQGSNVIVSALCPGPVDTEFQQKANIKLVKSKLKNPTASEVATVAYKELMKGKTLIVPGKMNQVLLFCNRFIPRKLGSHIVYKTQLKKK